MRITILSVGKVKENYLQQAIAHYAQRLRPYCKLQLMEVPDEAAPEQLSPEELEQVKQKEGERLLSRIKPGQYVIALAIKGRELTSEQFAQKLEQQSIYGQSDMLFIIGGSNGLAEEVLKRADLKLSFSKFTFPHQLMKLILLEQIYRAFKIMRGEPYHK